MSEIFNWELGTDHELIGQPVVFGEVVGHVVKFEGSQMKGCSSIVHVRTPHGSMIRTGRAHCRRASGEELKVLEAFVEDARKTGKFEEPPREAI